MKRMRTIICLLFIISSLNLVAQSLSAYTDYKNYFQVFDNGVTKELEYMPVQWYKIGGNTVVYLDNANNLKAYYKGEKYLLNEAPPTACFVNDEMVIYLIGKVMQVFDKGNIIFISGWATDYIIGDSIVGAVDQNAHLYKIYYHGQINSLPDAIDLASITSFSAGDNLLAYKNMEGFLKVYYRNQVFSTEASQATQYKSGANTVAFVNESTQEFSVFYKGNVTVLESQPPRSFAVADNMVAYVDVNETFKVFYNGVKTDLTSFTPQFYKAIDNILVYFDNINLMVFYKGNSYTLDRIIPQEYKIDKNTFVYQDTQGFPNVFSDGKTAQVYNEKINVYDLSGNTLKYTNSMNETRFFVNGKTY